MSYASYVATALIGLLAVALLADNRRLLKTVIERISIMSAELDRLKTEVAETNTAIGSVLALVEGLAQQIRDNATDPAALTALADELDAQQQAIADAVAANTPSEGEPQP